MLVADYLKDASSQWPLWVRPNARIWNAESKRLVIPVVKDDPQNLVYWVGEGENPTCTDAEYCKETLEWFKMAVCRKIYDQAEVQSPAVARAIPRQLGRLMFMGEELYYWTGTGTGQPLGIAPAVVTGGSGITYTDIYQTLTDMAFAVGQYATDNAHFYCGPTLYRWLYAALDFAGYLFLPQTPMTSESVFRQFMVKGLGKYVRCVPCLDNGTYDGYLFFGDLAHYNIIQHSGDGVIPLFGLERVGHTDETAMLQEYSTYKVSALLGGRLNFSYGQGATCIRRTWSYADLSTPMETPYQGVARIIDVTPP